MLVRYRVGPAECEVMNRIIDGQVESHIGS